MSSASNKKENKNFHSKKIKHDPQAESARAVYGIKDSKATKDKDK